MAMVALTSPSARSRAACNCCRRQNADLFRLHGHALDRLDRIFRAELFPQRELKQRVKKRPVRIDRDRPYVQIMQPAFDFVAGQVGHRSLGNDAPNRLNRHRSE